MRQVGAALGLALVLSATLPGAARGATVGITYGVGEEPMRIAVDPNDVANSQPVSGPGSVAVITPGSTQPTPGSPRVARIQTSSASDFVAVDASNHRLYSSNLAHTVQVFDTTTFALQASLPVGGLGIVVDPATQRVYVAGGTSVTVIDGATNTVAQTVTAFPLGFWFGVAHDPALHKLYITNASETTPSLVVLDDRDLSLIREIPLAVVPRFAIAVDSSQHRLYVAGADKNFNGWPASMFYAIDGATLTVIGATPVSGFPGGIALAPATHRIYLTWQCPMLCSSGYREIDDRTFEVARLVTTPASLVLPVLHPDGRLYVGAWTVTFEDEVLALDLDNHSPKVTTVSLSPSSPLTNDILHVTATAFDPDFPSQPADALTIAYQWLRNNVVIPGATAGAFDLSAPDAGDRGDTITVRVTASDGQMTSAPVSVSVVVADSAPTAGVALDVISPRTSQLLTATGSSSDLDGDVLTYTFTWKVNSVVRSTASGPNASSSFDLGLSGNGDRGQTVSVEVVASDGTLQSAAASAFAVVANTAPTITLSLGDTSPQTRDILVATANAQDADGDPLTLTYTWSVNNVVMQAGANNRFDLAVKGHGDNGDVVSVTATASDGTGSATASASATITQKKH
jgi:DNA-binding beta-propeller fold protein YncE